MPISIQTLIRILSKSAPPEAHTVIINGEMKGTCTRASFRPVFSFSGIEFVVDYSYSLDNQQTNLSSRLRTQGVGKGGREQILENGQNVTNDDVLIGGEDTNVYVEFRFKRTGETQQQSVKFVAPLTAFKD